MTLGSTSESGPSLIRQPVILRRIPWPAGNGHFQQSVVQEAVDASSEVSASTGMASGCNQRFGRDGAVERRSKHSDLFRRQCGLALLAPDLALTFALDCAPDLSIAIRHDSGPALVRHPILLRWRRRFVGNGHFQKTSGQEGFQPSLGITRSAGMANGCRQRFSGNSAIETRLKHGHLFRRQCGLARLAPCMAPDLAPGMARLYSCSALGRTVTSECRRISTSWCYSRPHDLPGYLPQNCCPANRGDECIGDGELGFRQVGLNAAPNHVQGFRSHAFDVLGQVQRLRQQGIAGQPEPGNPAPCPPRKSRTRGTARGQYIAAPGPWASLRPPSCRR